MKTFRELISWELEQERKMPSRLQAGSEEMAQKLTATVLRKIRYLNAPSIEAPRNEASSSVS